MRLLNDMRFLDTLTGQFVEKNPMETLYAMLSHTSDRERGEQTYEQLKRIQKRYAPKRQARSNTPPPHTPSPLDPMPPMISRILGRLWRFVPFAIFTPSIWDDPRLSPKIRMACALALQTGYRYIWIDFCCIDKTSSIEFGIRLPPKIHQSRRGCGTITILIWISRLCPTLQ